MQPWVFHLSNLLYHWITACFVFLVALRLTNAPARSTRAIETMAMAARHFIAFLWALHPVQTDAVTYIAGRRDILGGLCLFAGLWAYLRFRSLDDSERVAIRLAALVVPGVRTRDSQ